ncbi:YbaB/EbfC family nucleoid-associated protein [Nocardiopsis mangrovi]|uniref:YbaB/EbfC family nucleoid-associated protein n=1 Tax=Nocardiopsis mangrovi TaxID=1179818 RepID=A0ABV9E496_9ACTN
MSSYPEQMEQALARLREDQEKVTRASASLASATEEAVSKDRAISAKINADGELVELKFRTTSYQSMPPAELSAAVMDVIKRARDKMQARVMEAFGPFAPEGIDMEAARTGGFDPAKMLADLGLDKLDFPDSGRPSA